jgi:hypothetical protein
MRIPVSRTFVLSVAGVTAAGLLCAVALARALTVEPVAPAEAAPAGVASEAELDAGAVPAARVPSESVLEMESLALAVDHDPFMPDRRRAEPYRLPGEYVERPMPVRREEPEPPPFRVIGTAQVGDQGIALVEVENSSYPEVVKVGETLFGYRLQRVETEAATMVGQGQAFRLAVERGAAQNSRRRGDDDDESSGRNSRNARQAAAAMERAQTILEQLRERGLPTEMMEQVIRQQVGGRTMRDIEIVPNDGRNRAIIRVRPDTSTVEMPRTPEPR